MKKFFNNIELYIAMVTISITTTVVILNVVLRYVFSIQFLWLEEVSLGCFIWTVYLGAVAAYKNNRLIGVDFLLLILPHRFKVFIELCTAILMVVANLVLLSFSITYTIQSQKITAALEVSYVYINISLVFAFFLMSLQAFRLLIKDIKILKHRFVENKEI